MSELEADSFASSDGTEEAEEQTLYVEIHVLVGAECITIYRVPPGEYLIGRDSSCHLAVDADNVSRMHARLAFHGHRIIIEDLESANGTLIGGIKICLPTPIQNGTEVHIGAARLLVQFNDETLSRISAALADPSLGLEPIRNELTQDPYFVTGTIAEGGMGLVVKARDQRVRRLVAMKVLRGGYEYAADKLLRFVGEAQLTGQLEHPNIIPIYQLGISANGQTFYTMKYIRGQTLEEIIMGLHNGDQQTLARYPLASLLTIFLKVLDAMAFAHSRGVVHRDLKPANIMIGAFGEVLVMDWGLAKRVNEGSLASSAKPAPKKVGASGITRRLTQRFNRDEGFNTQAPRGFYTLEGAVVGTPPYISPEQAQGESTPNPRSDIHVLGSILYAILTLRPPILLNDVDAIITAVAENKFIPIRKVLGMPSSDGTPAPKLIHCPGGKIPEGLTAVVEKAMHVDPNQRYQSVEEFQADISFWQSGFATKAEQAGFTRQLFLLLSRRRREALFLGVFGVILFSSLAYFLRRLSLDRWMLEQERAALAENNIELQSSNQRFELLIQQLRATSRANFADALRQLAQGNPKYALEQINLALVGAEEESLGIYILVRAHANTALHYYAEALADYQSANKLIPGIVPLDVIETDLDTSSPDAQISRPPEGWAWEKNSMTQEKAQALRKFLHSRMKK
ncbi:MAG: FHA domain-containing serine/threonine-protein kinase [Verrucomicrobiota bacterium]